MKHLFRLLLLLLALLMPATATGDEGFDITCDFEVDGFYYEILGNNQVAVTYQGIYENAAEGFYPKPSYTGNVSIPETVSYKGITYSVTSIGYDAFCDCSDLTSVTIPNSITSIGSSAFNGCIGLTSVSIPNSVTTIGRYAFYDCSGLTSVTIPNSVTIIGSDTFYGTAWYDNQPAGLVYAGKVAYKFKGTMPAGTSIILADGTLGIAGSAFRGCSGLTSVTIPNSVTTIGDDAFYGCSGLTSVTIPNSVTSIGNDAFWGCSGLTNVTIGSSVTSIGYRAFYNCSGITSVTIPNTVTIIGDHVFYNCSSLTSVTIPNSVTIIGREAFYGTAWYNNQPNGLVYAGLVAYKYKGTMPSGTSIILADGTLGIAGSAFYGCSSLTSVDIPNSVTSIGDLAFYGCSGLTNVTIGSSVTSIGCSAFNNCIGLTSVTIPNSVTNIDFDAFYGCSGLNDVFSFIVDPTTVYLDSDAFALDYYPEDDTGRTLHVPTGTVSAYKIKTEWSWYFDPIVEMGPMVATSIELDRSTAMMEPGEKLQLKAELQPIEAIYNEVLWGSSNPAVATVSNNGLVTAVNAGTATITAMTTDGSNLSASCIVTVYTEMMGDVDGNGSVNISDVTALIDYLLNDDASAIVLSNADSDGSGAVNISDVTALIDFLLIGHWPEPEPTLGITSYTVNGVTFNMVEVEGGTFQMGATSEQGENANDNEKPVHQVTLSDYSIGQTEVTQELWQAVMGSNPSKFNDNVNKPVENISWEDCQTFIATLNELTGQNFRLPTEAEWEFAARGGMKSQGYRYAGSNDLDEIAWYNYNAYAVGSSSPDYGTHAVSTKAANELGLYDMTGNVWEWCQDWSGDYSAPDQINPTGPETGTNRVIRGGGWTNYPKLLRIAARSGYKPGFIGNFIGFRLAL